ncbi:MAG: hypothetical protein WD184_00295 [Acidimicrobiia bacterium]
MARILLNVVETPTDSCHMRYGFHDDEGFSLIDAAVATVVAMILVTAFGGMMGSTLRGSRTNAQAQEATAIGTERIEYALSLTWESIAMSGIDGDAPMLGGDQLLAADAGLEADESLVELPAGLIPPRVNETVDTTSYTIWQYVTDAGDGLRRVVVLVTWVEGGMSSSHNTSVLVSEPVTR